MSWQRIQEGQKLIVAIDYDDTYSAMPEVFNVFIRSLKSAGHRPIIVTARPEMYRNDIEDALIEHIDPSDIYCTNLSAKQEYMINNHNIFPHIWIDDYPLGIVEDRR